MLCLSSPRANRSRVRWPIALLGAACIASHSARGQEAPVVSPLSFSRTVLPNGLVAIVNEDHTTPLVAVDVWYHIGAKNERAGQSGLAHLCEHLMDEGSLNEPLSQKVFIQSIGGTSAHWAVTTEDVTHFFATVPSNQLETMLWLESDRMASPLSRADSAHVAGARDVIRQERLQDEEGPVFGVAQPLTIAALFPHGHPYSFDPIGAAKDLAAATAADARSFCLPYYVPSNAVISVSGDALPAHTISLIKKYFGGIARRVAPPQAPVPASSLAEPVRLVLEDARAKTAQLRIAWPTVGFAHADRVALNALASVLSRDRVGRLSRLLVYEQGLATRVVAANYDFEQGGLFQIDIWVRPAASMTRTEQLVDSVLDALATNPPTAAELQAFGRSNAVLAVVTLQTRAARADTLAHGEIFARDPVAYATQVDRALAIAPSDVARAARRYLTSARMVMSMVPAGKLDLISEPDLPFKNVTPSAALPAP